MASKIVDLNLFKIVKAKAEEHFKNTQSAESPEEDLKHRYIQVSAILLESWKEFAIGDNLNKFVMSHFKDRLIDRTLNYTSDLNAVSKLEQHIKLYPIILGPGTTPSTSIGWSAGFFMKGLLITTPEFSSEVYARCFGLLLFAALSKRRSSFLNVDLI
jgi:hypothetical protein